MKLTVTTLEGTRQELDASELAHRLLAGESAEEPPQASVYGPDDDADAETTPPPANEPGAIPGVPADGQAAVRRQLNSNRGANHFVKFLESTVSWTGVRLHGKKNRGMAEDDPRDYTDYLRLRRQGSNFGGFAYVYPDIGVVLLRLRYDTDEELHDIAPDAWRLSSGHRQYRVKITILDQVTLEQALQLARIAYDAT